MKKFNERKKEFIEKLRSNPQVIEMLTSKEGNVGVEDEMLEVIIDPKNEKELTVAESTFTMLSDLTELMFNAVFGNVKEIPMEENVGLKRYIDLINIIKEDGDINELKPTMKENARQLYELMIATLSELDESMQYIAEQTGFDLDDPFDKAKFKVYISRIEKSGKTNVKLPKDLTEEETNQLLEFCTEFHRLCEEGYTEDKENLNDMDDDLFSFFMKP